MNMIEKMSKLIFAVALAAALPGFAEITWTGKYSANWDTTTANWKDGSGNETTFTEGADVRFDDTAAQKTVYVAGTSDFTAGDIVVNASEDYVFTSSTGRRLDATSVRKRGTGKLTVKTDTGSAEQIIKNYGTGLFVEEGEVCIYGNGKRALGQYKAYPNGGLFVSAGATLRLFGRNIFTSTLTESVTTPIVVNGGTFIVEDGNDTGHVILGPLQLVNATVDFAGMPGTSSKLGAVTFSGKLSFSGSTPYEILTNKDRVQAHLDLHNSPLTEIEVADITGDAQEDVVVAAPLSDRCTDSSTSATAASGFVKTGAGALALTATNNTFSGNIEVTGGTLQLGPNTKINAPDVLKAANAHWIGSLANASRTVTVRSGAALYLPNRNTFGPIGAITNACSFKGAFVFDGGVFTNGMNLSTGVGQSSLLPDVAFANGGTIAPGEGQGNYGRFMVYSNFTVTGSVPFEWNLSENTERQRLRESLALNGYPENVFTIDDVTGDSAVDATFGVPFIINFAFFNNGKKLSDWSFGFTKTGAGTMRITAPSHSRASTTLAGGFESRTFNGDAKVAAGTLQVDGDISLSDTVRVSSGAYIAGTGTVNNVQIAAGGGLRVRADGSAPLRIAGNLDVASGAVISVDVPENFDLSTMRVPALVVGGTITGAENLEGALVLANGEPLPRSSVSLVGNTFYVKCPGGFTLMFR